jgi:hypothetical protein
MVKCEWDDEPMTADQLVAANATGVGSPVEATVALIMNARCATRPNRDR